MGIEQLETDADGMLITRPVLGWVTMPVMGMSVLLRLQYAETPAELETGGRRLQVLLTPQACLHLADELTKQARQILDAPKPNIPAN